MLFYNYKTLNATFRTLLNENFPLLNFFFKLFHSEISNIQNTP